MHLVVGTLDGVDEHLHRRGEQNAAEQQKRPREVRDQLSAERDEDPAQHQRSGHSEQQHPLLQLLRHGEGAQQQHEHEQVVDRERLLDQVPGVVLQADLAAVRRPHPNAEGDRKSDVEHRPPQRLFHAHLVGAAGDDEVEHEQGQNDGQCDAPEQGGTDGVKGHERQSS